MMIERIIKIITTNYYEINGLRTFNIKRTMTITNVIKHLLKPLCKSKFFSLTSSNFTYKNFTLFS